MPGLAAFAGAWILERLFLESLVRQPGPAPPREQAFAVRGDKVRHASAEPDVAVEPEAAVHRVDHPVATSREFPGLVVRRALVRHRPTIAPGLLAEQLPFDQGGRQRRHTADKHRALDGIGQRVRDLG